MPVFSKDRKKRSGDITTNNWTFSMVSAYLRCPKSFELQYVKGMEREYGSDLVEGVAHHDALDEDNKNKYKEGRNLSLDRHIEIFADTFSYDAKHISIWNNGVNKNDVIRRGKGMIRSYKNHVDLIPGKDEDGATIEKFFQFRLNITGEVWVTFQGFMDIIGFLKSNTLYSIYDYKVTGKAKTIPQIMGSIQLDVYHVAAAKMGMGSIGSLRTGFISLVKSNQTVDVKDCLKSIKQINWSFRVIKDAISAALKGCFPTCSPDNYLCSPVYCGYYRVCRGRMK